MKKVIVSILTLCTVVSFTACGESATTAITEADLETWTEQDFENALQALESAEASSEQENATTQEVAYEATEEILNAKWDSGLIQINDKLVQLPLHLSDWLALGFDYQIDFDSKSKDYLFNINDLVSLNLTVNGEDIGFVSFKKTTEGFETLESINPLIEKIQVTKKPQSTQFFLPGGLTIGDTYQVIEEKLGTPAEITDTMMYRYGRISSSESDLSYGIQIFVNRDTQQVSSFDVAKSITANNVNDLTTITFHDVPNVQTSDTHNVSLLLPPVYKQIPGFLVAQRVIDTVIDYEGTKYYMNLSLSLKGQKYANPYEYLQYGDPILDTTDENGISRRLYNAGYAYVIVCSTDVHILEATVQFENMEDASADSLATLQEFTINIANSIQYE